MSSHLKLNFISLPFVKRSFFWTILYFLIAASLLSFHHIISQVIGFLLLLLTFHSPGINKDSYQLLSIPVVLAALPPVPANINFQLILGCLYLIGTTINFSYRNRIAIIKSLRRNKYVYFVVFAVLFLGVSVNFCVAHFTNSIPISDWFRGIIPFSFLVLFPLFVYSFKLAPHSIFYQPFFFAGAGLVHVLSVVQTYYSNELWKNLRWHYSPVDASWRLLSPLDPNTDNIYITKLRVTLLQPNATSILIIVALIVFSYAFLISITKINRIASFAALSISAWAACAAYSRSMIATIIICFLLLVLSFIFIDKSKKSVFKSIALTLLSMAVVVFSVFSQGTSDILNNRYVSTLAGFENIINQSSYFHNTRPKLSNNLHTKLEDPNIVSRVEETKAALKIFTAHPITGAGFGKKYTIPREVDLNNYSFTPTAYTHNIITYFLMTTGIFGTLLMLSLFIFPIKNFFQCALKFPDLKFFTLMQVIIVFGMFLYSMSFAVFRLPIFNVLLVSNLALSFVCSTSIMVKHQPMNDFNSQSDLV